MGVIRKVKKISKKSKPSKGVEKKPATSKKKKASVNKQILLPDVMDITSAEKFLADVKKTSEGKSQKVVFYGSKVIKITTPCVQILLSLSRTLADKNSGLVIKNSSEAMRACFSDLGLETELKKWST